MTIRCPICSWESDKEEPVTNLLDCSCCHITSVLPEARTIPLLVRPVGQAVQIAGEIPLRAAFLDRYQLLRVLATGMKGSLFLARGHLTGGQLSVRFLSPPERPEDLDRFVRVAKTLSLIRHPSVLQIVEGGEMAGHPYLVSEYVEGGLRAREASSGERIEPERAIRWMVDVLDGLAACHEGGVVHAGLCPERILVCDTGKTRITEPGIANVLERISGSTPGSVGAKELRSYQSPEWRQRRTLRPASDLYSVGVILYELLSGVRPVDQDDEKTAESTPSFAVIPPLDRLVPSLPVGLATLVHRAMSDNPDDRPSSAAAFAADLREIAGLPNVQTAPRPAVEDGKPLDVPKPLPPTKGTAPARFSRVHRVSTFRWVAAALVLAAIFSARGRTVVPVADVVQVRTLFEGRQFAKLTTLLEGYQTPCETDPRWEPCVWDAFEVFQSTDASYKGLVDDWVKAEPKNRSALTARAALYHSLGWKSRGTRWAKDTSRAQFRGMQENFEVAARDAMAALQINPKTLRAHTMLMDINKCFGDKGNGEALVKRALDAFPDSFVIRQSYMNCLLPRWSGSYEAMARFALESAPHAVKNPLIKTLPGLIRADQANMAEINGNRAKAVALYEKALAYGENLAILHSLAKAYRNSKMYEKALSTVDRALALRPNSGACHALRSEILFDQKEWDESLEELEEGARVGGSSCEEVTDTREWEGQTLMVAGHHLFKKNDFVLAIDKYNLALRFSPESAETYCWRGISFGKVDRAEAALSDLRKAIKLDPKLFPAYKGLDDVLIKERRFDEIIEAWTRFLQLEPNNANAYVERSGTYYRKGDLATSIADAQKACELGNADGCRYADRMRKMRK